VRGGDDEGGMRVGGIQVKASKKGSRKRVDNKKRKTSQEKV